MKKRNQKLCNKFDNKVKMNVKHQEKKYYVENLHKK
jgi:hypothetical protein